LTRRGVRIQSLIASMVDHNPTPSHFQTPYKRKGIRAMLSRPFTKLFLCSAVVTAMLTLSLASASAFTLSSPSVEPSFANSQIEKVYYYGYRHYYHPYYHRYYYHPYYHPYYYHPYYHRRYYHYY
jgi:hypothetical protein